MTEAGDSPTWSVGVIARALVIGVIAVSIGAILGYVVAHERAPSVGSGAGSVSASARDRACLGALREGSRLVGYEITRISPVNDDGVLLVEVRRERTIVRLLVAYAAGRGSPPPATAGRYAVFYATERTNSGDGERLARALAAVLRANADAPPPPGLQAFAPGR